MAKKKKKSKKGLSLVEKVRKRLEEGGGGYDYRTGKYIGYPEMPSGAKSAKVHIDLRLYPPTYIEHVVHWMKHPDGAFRPLRCQVDKFLKDERQEYCLMCLRNMWLASKGKKGEVLASRQNRTSTWLWNALLIGAPPFRDPDSEELYTKIFGHGWGVFKSVGDIMDVRKNIASAKRGWIIRVTKRVKGGKTEYGAQAVKKRPLTEEEVALNRWNLDEEQPFIDDKALCEELELNRGKLLKLREEPEEEEPEEEEEEPEEDEKEKEDNEDDDEEIDEDEF